MMKKNGTKKRSRKKKQPVVINVDMRTIQPRGLAWVFMFGFTCRACSEALKLSLHNPDTCTACDHTTDDVCFAEQHYTTGVLYCEAHQQVLPIGIVYNA